ncbi:LysR substrate-binding domain-containing protein, partial [Ottowia sp.]|uniref:LysR substrate-binding domain-containing protein n=1 Tax=Ottowia sp. TaxID=1898956 RepID=UPI0039E3267B
ALPRRARAAAAGELGRVRLAFVSTIGFEQLPRWVRDFRSHCPDVVLELAEATGDVQLQALARGDIDAGLLLHSPGAAPPGLSCLAVAREPLVLALPEAHPLAQAHPLPLARVLAEPLVIFPRRLVPSLHDAVMALYQAAGLPTQVAQEAIQMQTIVNLVWGGLGVAWVPASVQQFRRAGVVYRAAGELAPAGRSRRAAGVALPACETSLVWPPQADNPALHRFVEFVREQLRATA